LSRFNVSPPHNPRPGTSEGTLQNNNKVEHSHVGWIYDQKTRTQNMVSEPKKVLSHQDSVILFRKTIIIYVKTITIHLITLNFSAPLAK
jgi:hypothetical protein